MHPNPPDQGSVHNLDDRRAGTDQPAANRAAKKQENKAKHAAQTKAKAAKAASRQPKCTGKTRAGFPCKSFAVKNGLCRAHNVSEEEYEILMEQARAVRRQAKVKPHELMRQVIESNPIAFMQPYLDSLGIRVIFVPDANDPRILHPTAVQDPSSNGATLFGVSKDGDVIVSRHKDLEKQQAAAERLFDRVYGKPKQTNIISGASQQNDPQLVPFDERRQAEVAAILEAAKSPSHTMPPNTQN